MSEHYRTLTVLYIAGTVVRRSDVTSDIVERVRCRVADRRAPIASDDRSTAGIAATPTPVRGLEHQARLQPQPS